VSTPIAGELGHLAAPATTAPFDAVRLSLLDTIIRHNADGALEQLHWEAAFEAAVHSLRIRVLGLAEAAVREAATRSRYPARRLRAVLPDAEAAEMLINRMLAEGMPLERLEGLPATPMHRRARATALEASWDGAVRVANAELARWRAVAAGVDAWRRPALWAWIITAVLLGLAGVLAAWFSGEVPSPAWFRSINAWWWRLWP
jgi:hypothetical protein